MGKIKIAIAEDHEVSRRGLIKLLETENDFSICISVSNGKELIEHIQQKQRPDIILMDIRMPIMDGIEATSIIKQRFPEIKVIALTQFDIEQNLVKMNQLGVKCFFGKSRVEELARAIKIVFEGGVYFPDEVGEILQRHLAKQAPNNLKVELSKTELTVLTAIGRGWSSTKIGPLINKSSRTVEKYREDIYEKFGVESKEQLIIEATKMGLI